MNTPDERPSVKACHVCEGTRLYYLFSAADCRVVRCDDCGLIFLNPQPADAELARIYDADYFIGSDSEAGRQASSELKRATARMYLAEIVRYRGSGTGRLLEVGCGDGDLLELAEADGWGGTGIEYSATAADRARRRLKRGQVYCGELRGASFAPGQFDLCVISDALEQVRSPREFLGEIHHVLKPGGTLFVATPSVDSSSARLHRKNRLEFKTGHLTYFDPQTLQTALFKTGFREVIVQPDYRRTAASGIVAFARKAEVRARQVLSVVVPAYNEANTFGLMMDGLLRKELPNLDLEIIVVESNSTDGTRDLARKYATHPRVKLILQQQPRGKGNAVRAGLDAATGDYILIQDADLEYDFEDYDALLEQLTGGRSAFVLGSRHGGRKMFKMRRFTGQQGLSLFVNSGHWLFTTLINVLFFQRLRDPFTMFKVFRRDCLFGLELEYDRFDFDFELLIKLIRKGYRPVELPVNYRSRSFAEGKKVRLFRDPLTWLKALVRLRLAEINPMKTVERMRTRRSVEK